MGVKYHINPERGPLVCSASAPDKCHYGADAKHYDNIESASSEWEKELAGTYGTFSVVKNTVSSKQKNKEDFMLKFDGMPFDEIQDFTDSSKTNFEIVDEIINDRVDESRIFKDNLNAVKPYDNDSDRKCDEVTYASMVREYNDYRDRTAELVEAYTESKFYEPKTTNIDPERIKNALKIKSLAPNTKEWIENRSNFVGGSDVGLLAMNDFLNEKEIPFYAKSALERVEQMKSEGVNSSDINKIQEDANGRAGAMYRGTVWESRIRDSYVDDHPEYDVINTKSQYANADREWQQVNVDGVIVPTGSSVPEGILEIKTSSNESDWTNGIPVGYRAQTLYYLNATGLKYADVRVLVNDNKVIDHRIFADEEIVKGSGVNIESYINDRVKPWFENMRNRRNETI